MIMSMRKETQLPLKNCREALVETDWDFEAAKVYLKKEAKRLGLKKMASLGKVLSFLWNYMLANRNRILYVNCKLYQRNVLWHQFIPYFWARNTFDDKYLSRIFFFFSLSNPVLNKFLASRAVTEGLVGTHINGDKVAMIIVNCESEPVAKTDEFNQLLQILAQLISNQEPGNYAEEAVLKMDGVHDAMVDAIGLLRENIRIKKAQIVQGKTNDFQNGPIFFS